MDNLDQSSKDMFAELDQLNARFKANVSDLTVSFESASGEQCNYHMYGIANNDILAVKLAVRKEAIKCKVKILRIVAHSPDLK
jgi:hypothetical protein